MSVIVTQAARRARVARAVEHQRMQRLVQEVLTGKRARCTSGDGLGRRRCALPCNHSGRCLMASEAAERWALEGRWPV